MELSELQKQHQFVFIQFAEQGKRSDELIMATRGGAQYIFRVRQFESAEELRHALVTHDKDDRQNLVVIPELLSWIELLGNMQHIPMERLDANDVYKDVQEVKREAADWYAAQQAYNYLPF